MPAIQIDIGLPHLAVALVWAATALGGLIVLGLVLVAAAINGVTHFERWKFEAQREDERQALATIRARQANGRPAQFTPQERVPCDAQICSP